MLRLLTHFKVSLSISQKNLLCDLNLLLYTLPILSKQKMTKYFI